MLYWIILPCAEGYPVCCSIAAAFLVSSWRVPVAHSLPVMLIKTAFEYCQMYPEGRGQNCPELRTTHLSNCWREIPGNTGGGKVSSDSQMCP